MRGGIIMENSDKLKALESAISQIEKNMEKDCNETGRSCSSH